MSPREIEIALEAAGRSSDPVAHAKRLLEVRAVLHGQHAPILVWPTGESQMTYQQKAAWHEAQAAECREAEARIELFVNQPFEGFQSAP